MSTITDVLTILAAAVGGYFVYEWWLAASGKTTPAQTSTNTPVTTPTAVWNWSQWIIPSTAPDLTTQWQQNAAAANVGGITATWSWDVGQDIAYLGQWSNSVLTATGLRW